MTNLQDIMGYICAQYPYKTELSKARLTKLVYLADWKSCLEQGQPISQIKWVFNHFGPYVDDIVNEAMSNPHFNIARTYNAFGERKDLISLKKYFDFSSLTEGNKSILDAVIDATKKLNWEKFIQLIYSTYPIIVSSRMDVLDLPKLALDYKNSQN